MSITRHQTNARMSQAVLHGDTIYLAGQVGTAGESVTAQTTEILGKIDALLATCGSDKSNLLQAIIWLKDMNDFNEMNAVWDAWVPNGAAPARACGSADLATPDFTVEITVIAAKG
ncbi:MAG: RidA family protein [Pseudomonadota bacterium]